MKFKNGIVAVFMLLLVVGVVFNLIILDQVEADMEEIIGGSTHMMAEQTMTAVRHHLSQEARYLEVYADQLAREPAFQERAGKPVAVTDLQALDTEWGEENRSLERSVISGPVSEDLRQFQKSFHADAEGRQIGEVFVTDRNGGLIAATDRPTDFNQMDERWWQVAREGEVYVGDADFDVSAGMVSLVIAVPVRDESGEVVGVLKMVDSLSAVGEFLRSLESQQDTVRRAMLINGSDYVLWSSDQSQIGRELALPDDVSISGNMYMTSTSRDELVVVAGGRSEGRTEHLDVRLLVEYDPVIGQQVSQELWQGPVIGLILFGLFGFAVVAVGVIYVYRPLQELTRDMNRVSRRAEDVVVDPELLARDDTLGELARAFDRLRTSFKLAVNRAEACQDEVPDAFNEGFAGLEKVIDEAPIGVTVTDPSQPENPIIYVNEGFQHITGYDSEEILGRNCRFLQGEETDAETVADLRDAINAEEPVARIIRNYRKDGEPFWNLVHISPVFDERSDRSIYFLGFQFDLTAFDSYGLGDAYLDGFK